MWRRASDVVGRRLPIGMKDPLAGPSGYRRLAGDAEPRRVSVCRDSAIENMQFRSAGMGRADAMSGALAPVGSLSRGG